MSEGEVTAAPRRRSQAEAEQLAAEFEASGVSRREFCRMRGLKVPTLDAYRKRLRQRQPEEPGRFVSVEVAGGKPKTSARSSGIAVVLAQGRRIEVELGFDAATLEQLLRVLERI